MQRNGDLAELIGTSSAIGDVRALVNRVAGSEATVLVTGPSGSGKDVVARLLHQCSARAARPFIAAKRLVTRRDVELAKASPPPGRNREHVAAATRTCGTPGAASAVPMTATAASRANRLTRSAPVPAMPRPFRRVPSKRRAKRRS